MRSWLTWIGGISHTANRTVLLRATSSAEYHLVSVYSWSQQHNGYRKTKNIASHGVSCVKRLTDPQDFFQAPFLDASVLSELCLLGPCCSEATWTITELSRLVWDPTTPKISSGGTGRHNSASKQSSPYSWLPLIFQAKEKSLLVPAINSPVPPYTHTSITTVATSRSCSISCPVLAMSDKTSPLCNSKTKLKQL